MYVMYNVVEKGEIPKLREGQSYSKRIYTILEIIVN